MRSFALTFALASAALMCGAPAASAQLSQREAQQQALRALGVRSGSRPVVVFRALRPLRAGTTVTVAGLRRLPAGRATASAARSRADLLRAAGVSLVRAPLVARVGREPAWFFYSDEAPHQAYQHPGRVVLVGQRSGRVTVSRTIDWPPLLNGRLPYFLRSYAGYRDPRTRAFARLWRPKAPSAVRPGAGGGDPLGSVPLPAPSATERQVAAQLAAERACAVRVGDTLGNFYDATSFDQTRSSVGAFFNRLASLDRGFVSARYRVRGGVTLARYVDRLVRERGCRSVFLYIAGGGYVHGGEPAVSVGVQGRADGRVEQQVVTAAQLRAIMRADRGVSFQLQLDAPGSGALLAPLRNEPNLLVFLSSSRPKASAFTALPDLIGAGGERLPNRYNAAGLMEFSNRGLRGLRCFAADAAEVDAAARAVAGGQSRSFLAWMLRRSFALCGEGSLADAVRESERAAAPPVLRTFGFVADPATVLPPKPEPPLPPLPPGPKNAAPTAVGVAVTTAEDTPVELTLAGADPDGDPLAYTVEQPAGGSVSGGTGALRTFTPAPDFNGTTTFAYTVSDGRASATATVTVTVTPVDDPPVVDAGAGTTSFVEDEPPVAVAPALTVRDADDDPIGGATVTIAGGYEAGQDELLFGGGGAISGSFDAADGTLTLTGTASAADYEAALRAVAFDNPSQSPSTAPRAIVFTVTAAGVRSAPSTRALTVTDVNKPPVLGGGGGTLTVTEGDPAAVLAPGLTVTDVDDPLLTGATMEIVAGHEAAEDELQFADQSGISGVWDAATGVLTLTGAATPAAYEAALRSVRYRNRDDDDPSTAARTVEVTATDGKDTGRATAATVTVIAVNDAPVLGGGGGTVAFTEDGPAVAVAPALTVYDVDDTRLAAATVRIGAGHAAGEDELLFSDQNGIAGAWDGAAGVLRLTGSATVADYQAALRSVRYRNSDDAVPSTAARTVSFTADDGDAVSAPVTTTVTVTRVNDAPVLTAGGGTALFSEADGTPVAVDPAIVVSDVDDTHLASATVAVGTGHVADEDELLFSDQNGIAGAWDGAAGELRLTGSATVADYQAALRSVRYRNTSADPDTTTRAVVFTVSDGDDAGAPVSGAVEIEAYDDDPVVTTSPGATVWADADVAVDDALTVRDPDTPEVTSATVRFSAGYNAGEDLLAFADTAAIGGAFDAATGTLTLTGAATVADYQAALRSVLYQHAGTTFTAAPRTVEFTVNTATGSGSATKQVGLGRAPQLTSPGAGLAYTENDPATAIDGAITVSDDDSTHLAGATVSIEDGFAAGEDVLSATTGGTAITAAYADDVLRLSGRETLAAYEGVLRSVAYRNTSEDPSTAARTIRFTVTDGQLTATATNTVTVTAVNDPPVVTTSGGATGYTEDGPAVAVDPAVTVSDVDHTQLSGATVAIVGGHDATEDVLAFVNQDGITGTWNSAAGTLTLTGTATVADYQAALRSVAYRNADDVDPSTAQRTVAFTVTDPGAATSAPANKSVTVTAVNDAPRLTAGGTLAYVENDPATAIDPALTLTDRDSPALASATVTIGTGHAPAEDVLTFADLGPISGSYDSAAGRLTLTGAASPAAYQAALRAVSYRNSSDDPSDAPRTVTFAVDDGSAVDATASATATVTVRPVNDAPVAGPDAANAVGNTLLAYGTTVPAGEPGRALADVSVLSNDSDVDGPGPLVVDVAASMTTSLHGGAVSWNADGTFSYMPPAGFRGVDTLAYSVSDQAQPSPRMSTGQVSVRVADAVHHVRNDAPAGGDGRWATPFNTLAAARAAATTAGETIYVHRGDGTSAGLGGGVRLLGRQRLISTAEDLVVGGETLLARTGERATIAGTVELASGNRVAGLTIEGDGTDVPTIAGGTGDRDGTIDDVTIAALGTADGLVLDRTSGTWDVDRVAVVTQGGDGIVATDAGTVALGSAGTVTVDAGAPGRALVLVGTRLSGGVDDVRTAGTGAARGPAVQLTGTTGSLALGIRSLAAGGHGLLLDSAEGVVVTPVASGSIAAGGTAVDIRASLSSPAVPPRVTLGSVSSTGGAQGIFLANAGAARLSIAAGSLSGQTDAAISIAGGSGDVSYGGTIGDGSGLSARIQDRTGGDVTLSGAISDGADAGGGIQLSGNSGGRTTVSGPVSVQTGAQPAVDAAFTGDHALSFSGGLDLRTSSGAGFHATTANGSGTVAVTGTANTISTTTGVPLTITGPDVAAGGVTFRSISSNGAPSGIVLSDTGSAGGFSVTGVAGTAGSGGTIASSTGPGVRLTNAANVELRNMIVRDGNDDGVRGSGVAGLAVVNTTVTRNGDESGEHGLDLTGLTGTAAFTGVTATANGEHNLSIVGDAGTLTATVDRGRYADSLDSKGGVGGDGIHFAGTGTGSMTLDVSETTFAANREDHLQVTTDATTTVAQTVSVSGARLTGGAGTLGGGITLNPGGDAKLTASIAGTTIDGAAGDAIAIDTPGGATSPQRATVDATITGNTIGAGGVGSSGGHGIDVRSNGGATVRAEIANNAVRAYGDFAGIALINNDSVDGTLDARVFGNTVANPLASALTGIYVLSGSGGPDEGVTCVAFGSPGPSNSVLGGGMGGGSDVTLRVRDGATLRLPGYAGANTDSAAISAFVAGRNDGNGSPSVDALTTGGGPGVVGGAPCA